LGALVRALSHGCSNPGQVGEEYSGKLLVAKVNTDENPEWMMKYGIQVSRRCYLLQAQDHPSPGGSLTGAYVA